MPEEKTPNNTSEKPPQESLAGSNGQGGSNQNPPSNTDQEGSSNNEDRTERLERNIQTGERWLIGITAAGVLVNIIIAYFYYSQLEQMREATRAATRASSTASESLEFSNGNFDRMMQRAIDQTVAQIHAADAARDANDRATKFFKEQQSPELGLSVSPHDFGKQDATIEVLLKNSGHSAAKDVSLRWRINNIGKDNLKGPRSAVQGFVSGRFPPDYPNAVLWNEYGDETGEELQVARTFDKMIDPNIPFDQQFPVLPPEYFYARVRDLGRRERATLEALKIHYDEPIPLEKKGTVYVTVGEIGPNQTVGLSAQGAYDWDAAPTKDDSMKLVEEGKRALYISCRFTYSDRYHIGTIQSSPDFCFKYIPNTGNFESCVKPKN